MVVVMGVVGGLLLGWNSVEPWEFPPVMTTGETVMVPALVLELTTGTLTVSPPRTNCSADRFPPESSITETMVSWELAAPVVVMKFCPTPNGPLITNAEGAKFTVPVVFPKKVGALTEYVADPLLTRPWT